MDFFFWFSLFSLSLSLSLSLCSVHDQLQSLLVPEQGVEQGLQNSNFVAERLETEDEGGGLHCCSSLRRLEWTVEGKCTAHEHGSKQYHGVRRVCVFRHRMRE